MTKLTYRRLKRPIQNPGLDEIGCLQQRIALTRLVREVLIQVTEKTCAPVGIREVVRQRARFRQYISKEAYQRHRAIAGKR